MKKSLSLLTISLLLGIGVLSAQNQNPKIAVLECFTSATCYPCAQTNPSLDQLINNNVDKLIAVKYHTNWPSPSNDPMNLHNPSDVSSKVSYYGIEYVPWSVGNGTWNNSSGSVTQNLINQWTANDAPVEIRMTHYLNDTQDTIFVVVMGRALTAVDYSTLRLNVAVLEKTMEYASAPCTNGERIFHNVMKKMLPNAGGEPIPAMQAGDYFAFKFSWALANVMNISELTAIAWLQDRGSKEMIQGCKPSDSFVPFYEKQAKISGIDHIKAHVCSGNMSPNIIVDNFGSETINTLTINVKANGETIKTVAWEGNIATCHSEKIELGELDFETEENNTITIELALINGQQDDYAIATYEISAAEADQVINKSFKLVLRTDDHPEAITWEVKNMNTGEIVVSGGPYEEVHKIYNEPFNLTEDACYLFTIYDATGNGLNGNSGYYGLKAGSKTLFQGSEFTDKEENEFYFMLSTGIDENAVKACEIYPNPSNGTITIDTDTNGSVSIYSTTGQMVFDQKINGTTILNLSDLEKGTYLVVLTGENGQTSKQVIVLQ